MGLFDVFFPGKVKAFAGIPGPKPRFPLGGSGGFIGSYLGTKLSWEVAADIGKEYGGLAVVWVGPSPMLVVNDPELVQDVLVRRMDDFYKKSPIEALTPLTTKESPFVLNGATWKSERDRNPFTQSWFSDWLGQRFPLVRDFLLERAGRLAQAGRVDLHPTLQRLTFDAFSLALMGRELENEAYEDFLYMTRVGTFRINKGFNLLPPGYNKVDQRWNDRFLNIVKAAAAKPDPQAADLVNTMLRNQPQFSAESIAIVLSNVYFGGCISSSSAMSTNLFLVSSHPDVAKLVRSELRQRQSPLAFGDLGQMTQLEYSLMESLRLLGPVPIFTRSTHPTKAIQFGGHEIPPDTSLILSNWYLHRDAPYWKDGTVYRPQRWANGGLAQNPMGSSYFWPFGMGPRTCMGKPFALFQIRLVLSVLHEKLDMEIHGTYKQCNVFGGMNPDTLHVQFKKP